jgi:predicted phage-related endonuclease
VGSTPQGISGSRAASILGLSEFSTPVKVWMEIMEQRQPGFCTAHHFELEAFTGTAATRFGLAFEDALVSLTEIETGMKINAREAFCELAPAVAGEVPVNCHADGLFDSGTLYEGKTTTAFSFRDKWGEPGSDRVPRSYACQLQHNCLCSGATSAVLAVLVFPERPETWEEMGLRVAPYSEGGPMMIYRVDSLGETVLGTPDGGEERASVVDSCLSWARVIRDMGGFHTYTVQADPALQSMMLDAYRDFWTRYVLTETPPPAETYSDILRLMPEPRGTVVADEQQERWASEYAQIGKEASQSKKQQDKLKALLLGAIERGAERPIDSDSVEAIVLRDRTGKKIASYSKGKEGRLTFRCGG